MEEEGDSLKKAAAAGASIKRGVPINQEFIRKSRFSIDIIAIDPRPTLLCSLPSFILLTKEAVIAGVGAECTLGRGEEKENFPNTDQKHF